MAHVICPECGTKVQLIRGRGNCPKCGTPVAALEWQGRSRILLAALCILVVLLSLMWGAVLIYAIAFGVILLVYQVGFWSRRLEQHLMRLQSQLVETQKLAGQPIDQE